MARESVSSPSTRTALGDAVCQDVPGDDSHVAALQQRIRELAQTVQSLVENGRQWAESEERYRQLFNTNPAIKLLVDPADGAIVDVNRTACDFYGYPREVFLTKNISDINTLPREEIKSRMTAAATCAHQRFVFPHRLASGEVRAVEVYSGPVAYGGRTLLYSIIQDVTERQKAAEQLDRFFAVALDLFCIADVDGRFLRVNPAWERVLGYPVAELEGKRFLDYVHPDDLADTLSAIARLKGQEEVHHFVNRYRARDSSYRFIEWRSYPVGNLIYAAARDITERKRGEDELLRQTSLLSGLLNSISDIVFFKDKDGVYLGCNLGFARYVGRSTSEIVGRTDSDLFDKDTADFYRRNDLLAMAQEGTRHNEEWITYPDGRCALVDTAKGPLRDSTGKVVGLLGVSRDITDRKTAETAVRASHTNLVTFFNLSAELLFVLDESGNIILANDTAARRLGYSLAEMVGISVIELHPVEVREEARRVVQAMLCGERESCPLPLEARDGRRIPVETRIARGTWNGQPALFGYSRDVSDLARSEEKFQRAFDSSPALMAISIPDTGQFVNVNEAFINTLGYARSEVIGKSSRELGLFDEAATRDRVAQRVAESGGMTHVEAEVRDKSGHLHFGEFSVQAITIHGQMHLLTVMNDITERKKAELALQAARDQLEDRVRERTRELREMNAALQSETAEHEKARQSFERSERRFRGVAEGAQEAIICMTAGGVVTFWNTAAERMFGYAARDVTGRSVRDMILPPMPQSLRRTATTASRVAGATGTAHAFSTMARRKDGSRFPIEFTSAEWMEEGARSEAMIIRDVSDRVQLERQIIDVSDAERRNLGHDLHDDLGQRLTGMSLLCRSLGERLVVAPEQARSLVDELASHLDSALSYVRMLARGVRPVEPKAEGLMDALQELAATTSRLSGVSCRVDVAAPVLLNDNAVAATLFRVAQEGVTNALRHAHPRSIVLSLIARSGSYELRVIDDGAGMSQDSGVDGMGMRIMRYRAALVGATVSVAPTPGGGTTLSCLWFHAGDTPLRQEESNPC